jgi:MFS family permease
MRWPQILGALASRNYRLYFAGQAVSLIGSWMTQTACLWLAYHLTSSAAVLGIVGFASSIPTFFIAPFAGVWVDRIERRRLLVATQTLAMLQSFALAFLALTGGLGVTGIIVLCLIQGVIDAFDGPARMSAFIEFVDDREHLSSAIALNSSIFNLARLIGPAIAGLIIVASSAAFCFLIDGISYLGVIASLLAMRIIGRTKPRSTARPSADFSEGFRYVFRSPPLRNSILLVACFSVMAFSYPVLTPIFAKDVFRGDARTLGWLMSSAGLGAIGGSLFLAVRRGVEGLGTVITFGGALMGLGLIGFALSAWLPLSLACLLAVGSGGVLLMASSNTLVQALVDDDKRGRVMSIFATAFRGITPWGNLLVGWLAATIGPRRSLELSGAVCLIVVTVFCRVTPKTRSGAPLT